MPGLWKILTSQSCPRCGHRWNPRGYGRSPKCPGCGAMLRGPSAVQAGPGCISSLVGSAVKLGLVAAAGFLLLAVVGLFLPRRDRVQRSVPEPVPQSTPRPPVANNPRAEPEATSTQPQPLPEAGTSTEPAAGEAKQGPLTRTDEEKARTLFQSAENFERNGRTSQALIKYREVVLQYHDTQAAKEAEFRIEILERK